ncbi:MAG TPA: cation:proton antiporter [Steroidobacteraceae bacterium]|jgi:CPA1 family monovalent cation:H+ antiporter
MSLFENLVLLLFFAAVLLVASRRLGLPYPTLLCLAGVAAAFLPIAGNVAIEPRIALAIFIAPALLDAAFDTAPRDLMRLWVPLLILAVGAVVATALAVAYLGWRYASMPIAAAVALGAIVAPPDAVASTAVLGQTGLPRHSSLIIRGESLLNDATALLIFGTAVALAIAPPSTGEWLRLGLAAPGGLLFGAAMGYLFAAIAGYFAGAQSSIIMQFTGTFGVWLLADRLKLSPVLAVVADAMIIASILPARISARDRVQSYAVWTAVVFVLNVLAFLLMGMQTRAILAQIEPAALWAAVRFALAVLLTVIVVRFAVVFGYYRIAVLIWRRRKPDWIPKRPKWKLALVLSWCGNRGLLTLAASLALPTDFPSRPLIILSAMMVVLGTLTLQGLTLRPLIRWLGLDDTDEEFIAELRRARTAILEAGLKTLDQEPEAVRGTLRKQLLDAIEVTRAMQDPQGPTRFDTGLAHAVQAERRALHDLRGCGEIQDDVFQRLEEELDWLELAALPSRELEVLNT